MKRLQPVGAVPSSWRWCLLLLLLVQLSWATGHFGSLCDITRGWNLSYVHDGGGFLMATLFLYLFQSCVSCNEASVLAASLSRVFLQDAANRRLSLRFWRFILVFLCFFVGVFGRQTEQIYFSAVQGVYSVCLDLKKNQTWHKIFDSMKSCVLTCVNLSLLHERLLSCTQ